MKEENKKLINLIKQQKEELDGFKQLNQQLNLNRKYDNERNQTTISSLQKELLQKEVKIEELQSLIKTKDDGLKFFSINQDYNVKSNCIINMEVEKLIKEKEHFLEKIDSLERQLEDFYINRKSESALLLEVEHLKEDNLRLLNLLKTTEDFKDFAYLAEDCSGGVMFVKGREERKAEFSNCCNSNSEKRATSSYSAKVQVQGIKHDKRKE